MKPGPNFIWAVVGTAVLGVLLFLVFHFQSGQSRSELLAAKARKIELAGHIGLALASAAEAEKSSVLAITDEESKTFADQARAATANVEQGRAALAVLLQASGSTRESELLAQFSTAFAQFQQVDKELLDLAVKNTNLKASALAFGPAAVAVHQLDSALSRIVAERAKAGSPGAKEAMLAAASAQAAALRIQALLPPHIAEESDAKMDALERQMTEEAEAVAKNLKALGTLLPAGNADLQLAGSSYAQFTALKTQILQLSRENTNVRSLSISLNQKRKVTALCQDALAALDQAIAAERIPGVDSSVARPR